MFSGRGHGFVRFIRTIIDLLNILIGIAVVALAVMAFIMGAQHLWMFPLIFILGALLNLLSGIKYLMTQRTVGGIVFLVTTAVLAGIAFVTYYSVGGIL